MDLAHYQKARDDIMFHSVTRYEAAKRYTRLMTIFVQDCALPVHEEYFGNKVKAKAKILFDLYSYLEHDLQ